MPVNDRDLIVELVATYADAIDNKQYDRIAACFNEDASAVYAGYSEPLAGVEAIIAHMKLALEPLDASQHMFSNFIVRINDDSAELSCYVLAQHVKSEAHGGDTFLAGGKYKVAVTRTGGDWKFQKIDARSIWGAGSREMLPTAR